MSTTSTHSLLQKPPDTIKEALRLFPHLPLLEKELIISKAIGKNREFIYAHPEHTLSDAEKDAFIKMCVRREQGEPISYIIEEKEFFSLNFFIRRGVFIPRPETEFLVEESINLVRNYGLERILDLGTGCGAIGLSIAYSIKQCEVILSDVSDDAVRVSNENARRLNLKDRVYLVQGDWLSPFKHCSFDLIVSNPPYLTSSEFIENPELSFEPRRAFVAGDDGLLYIKKTLVEGVEYLKERGYILIEIGYTQAQKVKEMAEIVGVKVRFIKDLAGIKRVVVANT